MIHKQKKGTGINDLDVPYFGFRLSAREPEDRRLSKLMKADLDSEEVNLSAAIKSLLLLWYDWREATGEIEIPSLGAIRFVQGTQNSQGFAVSANSGVVEYDEDPEDELVKAMVGTSYEDWA